MTRFLTYRSEKVRAAYRADVPFGSPPLYDGKWKLIGIFEPGTDDVVRPAEAVRRLAQRDNHFGEKK